MNIVMIYTRKEYVMMVKQITLMPKNNMNIVMLYTKKGICPDGPHLMDFIEE